jgi:hypothetical protein
VIFSPHLSEGQIDALPAHQWVLAVGKRSDTVKGEPSRTAPYCDVAMLQAEPACLVAALQPAEQKNCR